MTQETKVGFDTVINGEDAYIEFTRKTSFGRELYGSDYDGNRGMWIDSIDDDCALDISVMFYDDEITESLDSLLPTTASAVKIIIDEYLDTHEAEMQEPPEPDYDDVDD